MSYKFPPIHNFKPFYTYQDQSLPASRLQMAAWIDIILHYMKSKKMNELDLDKALNTELFNNKAIGRQIRRSHAEMILARMVESQNASYIDEKKGKVKIIWRKPEDWAEIIAKWARSNSYNDVIFTFYELREGDDTIDQPFHMIDYEDLEAAAKYLESKGRGVFIPREYPKGHPKSGKTNLEECGMKIF